MKFNSDWNDIEMKLNKFEMKLKWNENENDM